MKYSKAPRHYAPRKRLWGAKNHPGHKSSGRGKDVSPMDPFALLLGIVPWLKKIKRTA